jgi:hypothetical protein
MTWTNIFKTAEGGLDVSRFVGVIGGLSYIICGNVVAFVMKAGLAEYCIAFPGGLAVVAGGTAGAVAIKDRAVAKAKAESEGGQ